MAERGKNILPISGSYSHTYYIYAADRTQVPGFLFFLLPFAITAIDRVGRRKESAGRRDIEKVTKRTKAKERDWTPGARASKYKEIPGTLSYFLGATPTHNLGYTIYEAKISTIEEQLTGYSEPQLIGIELPIPS